MLALRITSAGLHWSRRERICWILDEENWAQLISRTLEELSLYGPKLRGNPDPWVLGIILALPPQLKRLRGVLEDISLSIAQVLPNSLTNIGAPFQESAVPYIPEQ